MKLTNFKKLLICKSISFLLIVLHLLFFTCDGMAFAKTGEAAVANAESSSVPNGKEAAGTEVKNFQSQALEGVGEFKSTSPAAGGTKKQSSQQKTQVATASMATMSTTQASGSGTSAIAANFNISAIKNFSMDPFSGAATFSYPIAVAPGRQGLEPSIGLTYSSQNGNGVCGTGWDLPLGIIERSTKRGAPKYNSEDIFIFRSVGSSLELVSIGGNEYRPKIEGAFMKFVFNGSYWTVTDRQGKKYIFGSQTNSQISSAGKAFAWYLERVEDLLGNYLVVSYFKDSNQPYAQEIKYTGFQNNEVFPSRVVFEYEDRLDKIQSFRSSFDVSMKKRLKNIIVQHSGALVRKYILNYVMSNITNRSLLNSISQYYADNQPYLPPVSFSYAQKTDSPRWAVGGWSMPQEAYFIEADKRDMGVRLADVNADGLMDLVKGYSYHNAWDGVYFGIKKAFLNNGHNGWDLSSDWVLPDYFMVDRAGAIGDCGVRLFDVNNDGWPDFIFSITGDDGAPPQETRLNNKSGGWLQSAPEWKLPDGMFFARHTNWGNWPSPVLFLGLVMCDVNGDGRLDVVKAYGSDRQTYLNTGSGWALSSAWAMPDGDLSGNTTTFAEVNGDGLLDIIINITTVTVIRGGGTTQTTEKKVYLNNGNGWSLVSDWAIPSDVDLQLNDCQFMDVNGDGLSDIVKAPSLGEKKVYINSSQGWVYDAAWSAFPGTMSDLGTRVEDINADGVADVLVYVNNTTPQVFLAAGPYPDLLKTVNNGIGGTVDVSYNSYKGADNTVATEKSDLPFPVQVVSEVRYNDGMANAYPVRYQYDSAKFNFSDREFRGFGYVKTTDAEGGMSEVFFKQDDIYKGRPYRQKISDAAGHFFTMAENSWASTQLYPGVNFVYLQSSDNYIYDGDGTFKQTRANYEYDSFGNPTRVRNEGDVTITGDEKEKVTEYVKNGQLWLLGLPSHIIGRDAAGNIISEKWFYYDNNSQWSDTPQLGQLTKESVWLFNPLTSVSTVLSGTFAYDIYGNVISSTDPLGRTATTTFDPDYHIFPVAVTNALGQKVESTYDPKTGQVLTTKDLNNQVMTNVYDVVGRLSKVIGPNDSIDAPSVLFQYDLSVCPIKMTKQNKINAKPDYYRSYSFSDGLGRVIQARSPAEDDPITHIARQIVDGAIVFDSKGQVKEKYLPYFAESSAQYAAQNLSGPHATFAYDCLGRLVQTTNADNTTNSTSYSDWVVTVTDENNHSKTSYRDAYGNIVKVEEHNQGQTYTTTYQYDTQNNLVKITDNQNNVTQVWYDSLGRKLKMIDPDMGTWAYEYDAVGNLLKQTDNKNQLLQFTYDAINRLTAKQANGQTIVSYFYDDASKENCRGRLSYITDLSGRTDFYYDNLGREIKSEKTVSGRLYRVERTYDALDRLIRLTYPDTSIVQYSYNPQGIEKVEEINPATGAIVKTYVSNINYLPTGQMSRIEYGNGSFTDYQYDSLTLRLSNLKTNNGTIQSLSYQFDSVGNIKKITDDAYGSIQDFQYDDLDRLTWAAGTRYGMLNYTYDSIGNLLGTGGSTLSYSGANGGLRPHAVTSQNTESGLLNFEYDANGNMTRRYNEQNGLDVSYTYDTENRLVKVAPASQEQSEAAPISVSIALHSGWNFISLPLVPASSQIAGALNSLALYDHYDQVSRFNAATKKFEHYSGNPTYNQFDTMEMGRGYEIFICNEAGATLTFQGTAISEAVSVDLTAGKNIIGYPYPVSKPVSDALKNLKTGIDYDTVKVYNKGKGLIALSQQDLMEPGQAYVVNALHDCTLVFEPLAQETPQVTTEFVYDGDGGRVKKAVSRQSSVISETTYIGSLYETADGVAKKHIFAGASRIATVQSDNKTYFTHSDHLGSSNVITDDSGSVVQHVEYKPYGELASNELANGQTSEPTNYKFTGKELDDSTGLYFYGARYYEPTIGRFATPDTIVQAPYDPQSLNRYSYCRNNPLNYIDPTGHSWWKKFWNAVGDFFSGIGKAIAGNPGAFIAGLAVGIFTAWAIGPMISSFSSACAATGSGVTFGEGFLIGGMELGIPAFTGTLAGGLASGENFGTAAKNAAIVGGITFVTAGLIEGSYAEGWQKSIHFNDVRTESVKAQMEKYNSLALQRRFQEAMDVKLSLMKNYDFYAGGTTDIFKGMPAFQHVELMASKTTGEFAGVKFDWVGKNPVGWVKVLTSNSVKGTFSAIDRTAFINTRYTLLLFQSASSQVVNQALKTIPTFVGREANYILYGVGTYTCYQGAGDVDAAIKK